MKKFVSLFLIISLLASMLLGCARRMDFIQPQTNAANSEITPTRDDANYVTVAKLNSDELQ